MSAAKSDLDVLVLGHSHAYWLGAFIESAGLLDDLERLGHTCTVRFMGRRGASVRTFREPATMTRISARVPDIVVTLLGSNDLDGKFPPPPEAVGSQLGRLGDELLALGVRYVFAKSSAARNGAISILIRVRLALHPLILRYSQHVRGAMVCSTGAISTFGTARRRFSAKMACIYPI